MGAAAASFKASETLLGIETNDALYKYDLEMSFKASETLLGIETILTHLPLTGIGELQSL